MSNFKRVLHFLYGDEAEISYGAALPFVDISAMKNLEAPDLFLPSDDVLALITHYATRLLALSPHPRDSFAVGISPDFSLMALVRTPSPQTELDFDANAGAVMAKPLKLLAEEEAQRGTQALAIANAIQKAHRRGEIRTIDAFRERLSESPNPELTRRALRLAGKKQCTLAYDNQKFVTGGGEPFPTKLESAQVYVVELEFRSGTDEEAQLALACPVSAEVDDATTRALTRLHKIPTRYVKPADGPVLVAAQFGKARVRAEVSVSIETFADKPVELTLRRILNKGDVSRALRTRMENAELDFGD